MQKLCVIGSLNVDLTIRVPRFPLPGESIIGHSFETYLGGKGGNQSVAAARLGADVLTVGRLGEDAYGAEYLQSLRQNHVNTAGIRLDPVAASGIALIEVDPAGENRIVVAPGANMYIDRAQIDAVWPELSARDIFLLQLEIPIDTIEYVLKRLKAAGKTIVLDPAPAQPLSPGFLQGIDYVTPNETELALLTGIATDTDASIRAAAGRLLDMGARHVIAKLGSRGALLACADRFTPLPGYAVRAVDTTAAGDSFNAGLAVALAQRHPLMDAVRFANAVGALSTTAPGAQSAMPTLAETNALMERTCQLLQMNE